MVPDLSKPVESRLEKLPAEIIEKMLLEVVSELAQYGSPTLLAHVKQFQTTYSTAYHKIIPPPNWWGAKSSVEWEEEAIHTSLGVGGFPSEIMNSVICLGVSRPGSDIE